MLDLLRTLSVELLKVQQDAAYQTTGNILAGFLDGLEGACPSVIPPGPSPEGLWSTGFEVGHSLHRGASRHL